MNAKWKGKKNPQCKQPFCCFDVIPVWPPQKFQVQAKIPTIRPVFPILMTIQYRCKLVRQTRFFTTFHQFRVLLLNFSYKTKDKSSHLFTKKEEATIWSTLFKVKKLSRRTPISEPCSINFERNERNALRGNIDNIEKNWIFKRILRLCFRTDIQQKTMRFFILEIKTISLVTFYAPPFLNMINISW